jgi:hypothetical protein
MHRLVIGSRRWEERAVVVSVLASAPEFERVVGVIAKVTVLKTLGLLKKQWQRDLRTGCLQSWRRGMPCEPWLHRRS